MSAPNVESVPRYTAATAFSAEGARVGLTICKDCGSALLLDPRNEFDVLARHDVWHARIDAVT